MENETRMSKYKSLRDELKDDVMNNPSSQTVVNEEDDDFLSFIPKEEADEYDDTMITPIELKTSSKEEVDALMHKDENHNTRMDILSKIREEVSVSEEIEEEEPAGSLLDRLAQMSPKEDVEELEAYKKEVEKKEKDALKQEKKALKEEKKALKAQQKAMKKANKEAKQKIKSSYEDEEDDTTTLDKVLNYVTIALAVVAVVLFVLVIKNFLF